MKSEGWRESRSRGRHRESETNPQLISAILHAANAKITPVPSMRLPDHTEMAQSRLMQIWPKKRIGEMDYVCYVVG